MTILTYHHIGHHPPGKGCEHRGLWVTPENFESQLRWLRERNYVSMQVREVIECLRSGQSFPKRWVAITFDDGWYDNFTTAQPLLQRYGFTATIFVALGRLRSAEPSPDPHEMMSAHELCVLAHNNFEIGCHTFSHPKLTRVNDEQVRYEVADARASLAEIIGHPPTSFSYPYGAFSPRVEKIVQQAGYAGAVSTIRDNRVRPNQLFHLPRVMVMGDTSLSRFAYMFSLLYHWVHAWKNCTRWRGAG